MSTADQENTVVPSPGHRLALVVGVNEAPKTSAYLAPLQFAESSATAFAQVLQEKCNFELLTSLTGEEATTVAMQKAIYKLAMQRTDEDFLLLYFTGHGYPMVDEAGQHNVYLVTQDFDPAVIEELGYEGAYLSLSWLSKILYRRTKAGSVLIILDCCYGGNSNASLIDRPLDTIHDALKQYFSSSASSQLKGRTRATLSAAGRDAVAWERDGYSVMTRHLLGIVRGEYLEAIDDNGQVTLERLQETLRIKMPSDQKLSFSGEVVGNPLILATFEGFSVSMRREVGREQRLRAIFANHNGFLQVCLTSFVGREKELAELEQRIKALLPTGGYITITGQPGQGKSSIIAKLIENYSKDQGDPDRVAYHFIPLSPGADHQIALLRNLLARLILKYGLSEILADSVNRAVLRETFPKVLKEISDKGEREIIFIDGLDQLEMETTGTRDLTFLPHGAGNPPTGIVFVLGTRPNDTLRPLELVKQRDEVKLPNLSRTDFDRILKHRHVTLDHTLADRFYEQLEQNALYLDLVAKELAERGPISAAEIAAIIQQITDNPQNLFSLATDRFRMQEKLWGEVMKPILGLLLATNEPLSREQIKQLMNLNATIKVDGEQLNMGLEQLGGLIIADGQQRYTLFHLKFRDYLRQDATHLDKRYIFDSQDEQNWHQRFVNWCELGGITRIWNDAETDTVEQERRRYARHHYIVHLYSAGDWSKLFNVLDEGTYGKAKVQYDPSTRGYALDLDVGRQAAISDKWSLTEAIEHLPHLWRYTLLRCSLASRADNYPVEAFRLMLLLEQETKALGLAELITDPVKQAEVFTIIGGYFATQQGREREAKQMFTHAEARAKTIEDDTKRAKVLTALVSTYAQVGQWENAEQTLSLIKNRWWYARSVTALVTAYEKAGHHEKAGNIQQQVMQSLSSIKDDWQRSEVLTVLSTINVQVEQHSQTEQSFLSVMDEREQVEALLASAIPYVQAGQHKWQESDEVMAKVAIMHAQMGQCQQAEQALASITDIWESGEARTALVTAYARAGQWQEAEYNLSLIKDELWRMKAVVALATIYAQAGQWQQTKRFWDQAKKHLSSTVDEWQRSKIAAALTMAYAQTGQWQQVEPSISSIAEVWETVKTLTALATFYVQAGQWPRANHFLQRAEQSLSSIVDQQQRNEAMLILITAYAQAGQWQQAEQHLSAITVAWEKVKALATLATLYAQAEQWSQAERFWQQAEQHASFITDEWRYYEAIASLATTYAQASKWQQAEQHLSSIINEYWRVKALMALADSFVKYNESERLLRLVHRWWLRANTSVDAVRLLPLAFGFITYYPDVSNAFQAPFTWVDDFLRG